MAYPNTEFVDSLGLNPTLPLYSFVDKVKRGIYSLNQYPFSLDIPCEKQRRGIISGGVTLILFHELTEGNKTARKLIALISVWQDKSRKLYPCGVSIAWPSLSQSEENSKLISDVTSALVPYLGEVFTPENIVCSCEASLGIDLLLVEHDIGIEI